MTAWPDGRILDLFGIDLPIIQAPMAGAGTAALAVAVSEAGGLGSLACAQLGVDEMRAALEAIRGGTGRPINVNFFCHATPEADATRDAAWRAKLAPYFAEFGLDATAPMMGGGRRAFDSDVCAVVEAYQPEIVSFHFGLPDQALVARVRASGAKIISSATNVAEARWLEARGCDAIIAMGLEAGGHRGNFLSDDMARQVGSFALIPQLVDAVRVPVIAAGGIADARGIVAALALGAAAVQIGTAYLLCPEAALPPAYLQALRNAADDATALTNVFTGRPARGIVNRLMRELGPMADGVPAFPRAAPALAPLRAASQAAGSQDFTNFWAGQAAGLGRVCPAGDLTRMLAEGALARLGGT